MPKKSFNATVKLKVKEFAKLLGISDYKFHVTVVSSKNKKKTQYDNYGSIAIDEESREALITLNKDLLNKNIVELDNTIIHELLHCRLNEFTRLTELLLELYVKDKKANKMYARQLSFLEHKIIISISEALRKRHNEKPVQ
jgi:hypothetical protein